VIGEIYRNVFFPLSLENSTFYEDKVKTISRLHFEVLAIVENGLWSSQINMYIM